MKRIDRIIISICTLGVFSSVSMGIMTYNMVEMEKRFNERLEVIETVVNEIACEIEDTAEIDETVSKIENTVVSYDPPVEEVIEKVEEPVKPTRTYYDVPLSKDLQDYIFEVCESYGVDPAIIVAMIKKESTYRADIIGDSGNSYGLMQIQPRWHKARMDRLGVTNLLDPYQNVLVGTDYLAELIGHGQGLNWSLMAYNGGIGYANKKAAAGVVSDYARIVRATADELRN